ncbi:MAG: hypothetical protein QM817_36255 [Archangium sp.]
MSPNLALDIRRAMERLPKAERSFLLELAGISFAEANALGDSDVLDALTEIALATRTRGTHTVLIPRAELHLDVGVNGELLNCAQIDPLRPLRAGLVTGLPPAERPTAFALIASLAAAHGDAFDATGRRDLVSLVSLALGDALTARRK